MRKENRRYLILASLWGVAILVIGGSMLYNSSSPLEAAPPPPSVGMRAEERFHDIHTQKLKLNCELCHREKVETYNDPLAQVFNLVDKRACLSCHKEETVQPFFGRDWQKAKVKK